MKLVQRIMANNDKNGNPRRLWVVYTQSAWSNNYVVDVVIDEGYEGAPDLIKKYPELPSVWVTPSEYNSIKRLNTSKFIRA